MYFPQEVMSEILSYNDQWDERNEQRNQSQQEKRRRKGDKAFSPVKTIPAVFPVTHYERPQIAQHTYLQSPHHKLERLVAPGKNSLFPPRHVGVHTAPWVLTGKSRNRMIFDEKRNNGTEAQFADPTKPSYRTVSQTAGLVNTYPFTSRQQNHTLHPIPNRDTRIAVKRNWRNRYSGRPFDA